VGAPDTDSAGVYFLSREAFEARGGRSSPSEPSAATPEECSEDRDSTGKPEAHSRERGSSDACTGGTGD